MLPLNSMLTAEKMMSDKAILGTMNLFGVLVYTEEHPYIVKMLRDQDFWKSLNARSKGWILYAVRPDEEYSHLTDELLPMLGVHNSRDLPQLIILASTPEGKILQQNYPIDDSNVENAYHSLEKAVNIVSATAAKIIPSERNGVNVHREVAKALRAESARKQWKEISKEFFSFISFLVR